MLQGIRLISMRNCAKYGLILVPALALFVAAGGCSDPAVGTISVGKVDKNNLNAVGGSADTTDASAPRAAKRGLGTEESVKTLKRGGGGDAAP